MGGMPLFLISGSRPSELKAADRTESNHRTLGQGRGRAVPAPVRALVRVSQSPVLRFSRANARDQAGGLLWRLWLLLGLGLAFLALPGRAQSPASGDLFTLTPGSTKAVNALWFENPLSVQFSYTNPVTVAELPGPGIITMLHFADANSPPAPGQTLSRDLLLRIYWDGSPTPSVECPLVDFFCDPNGERSPVNTALVNVCKGYNAYFPMPFRTSAKIVLAYDGTNQPGASLENQMPCYAYVCYRSLASFPTNAGYFCASWRQQETLLGTNDYVALEATGQGKFVGWNVTVRSPFLSSYPVDENEKFYIDGATNTAIEFQGMEDSFGFSWGFPSAANQFPLTGYFPFHTNGAAAYRFFLQDAISFENSIKVAIGFGDTETGWKNSYSQPINALQFSSTVYWYQDQPYVALPPMPPAATRGPEPMRTFWPPGTGYSSLNAFTNAGGKLLLCCGMPGGELVYKASSSYSVTWDTNSYTYSGWTGDVFYCRASVSQFSVQVNLPAGAGANGGHLRLYIIDPDNYAGGRKETLIVEGQTVGTFQNFQAGQWIDVPITAVQTTDHQLNIQVLNARSGSNAVLSILEWIEQ